MTASRNGQATLTPHAYYRKMTTAQKQCRSRPLHSFPALDPGSGRLPPGYRIVFHDEFGRYFTEETCSNCGRIRLGVTIWEDGHFHPVSKYRYVDPDDWVRVPLEIRLSPMLIRGFLQDDCARVIHRAADRAMKKTVVNSRKG